MDIVKVLVEAGANVELSDYEGISPAYINCFTISKWPSLFKSLKKIIEIKTYLQATYNDVIPSEFVQLIEGANGKISLTSCVFPSKFN